MHERQAKDTFSSENKSPSCRFWILRLHKVVLCCGVASRCRHWPPLNCTAGWELVSGGTGEEQDAEAQHCLRFGVLGGGVYCRETGGRWDEEEEAEGEEEEGKERRRCLFCGTGLPTRVCLCACPHTVEINLPSVELWTHRGERCPNTTRTRARSKYSEG